MNYHEILGVAKIASKEQIQEAYEEKLEVVRGDFERELEVSIARNALIESYDNQPMPYASEQPQSFICHHYHHHENQNSYGSGLTSWLFWVIIPFSAALLSFMAALMAH